MEEPASPSTTRVPRLVAVKFRDSDRPRSFDAGQLALQAGDQVVVETDRGNLLGTVVPTHRPAKEVEAGTVFQRVIKKADGTDLERHERNRCRERDGLHACLQLIRERALPMKLIKAEQVQDGGKMVFYFSAEGRVDFRDLVRDLAHLLHLRVEMKQIGARDEAGVVGAVGPCGRELCCSTWLCDFEVVAVKMAKAQGLSLNPSKLAGMCGRLKCCLRYEYDTYIELGKTLPALGTKVSSVKGDGVVTRQHLLQQSVMLRREDGVEVEATLEELVQQKAR